MSLKEPAFERLGIGSVMAVGVPISYVFANDEFSSKESGFMSTSPTSSNFVVTKGSYAVGLLSSTEVEFER